MVHRSSARSAAGRPGRREPLLPRSSEYLPRRGIVGEDGGVGHDVERLIAALGLVAIAGCGDNLVPDPFAGLVQVSGASPFTASCAGDAQPGQNFAGL